MFPLWQELADAEPCKLTEHLFPARERPGTCVPGRSSFSSSSTRGQSTLQALSDLCRGAGTFGPNDDVTGSEAAKMILTALGCQSGLEGFTGAQWAASTAADMGVALRQTNGIVDTVTGASGGGWYKVYNFAGTSAPNTNFDVLFTTTARMAAKAAISSCMCWWVRRLPMGSPSTKDSML